MGASPHSAKIHLGGEFWSRRCWAASHNLMPGTPPCIHIQYGRPCGVSVQSQWGGWVIGRQASGDCLPLCCEASISLPVRLTKKFDVRISCSALPSAARWNTQAPSFSPGLKCARFVVCVCLQIQIANAKSCIRSHGIDNIECRPLAACIGSGTRTFDLPMLLWNEVVSLKSFTPLSKPPFEIFRAGFARRDRRGRKTFGDNIMRNRHHVGVNGHFSFGACLKPGDCEWFRRTLFFRANMRQCGAEIALLRIRVSPSA